MNFPFAASGSIRSRVVAPSWLMVHEVAFPRVRLFQISIPRRAISR